MANVAESPDGLRRATPNPPGRAVGACDPDHTGIAKRCLENLLARPARVSYSLSWLADQAASAERDAETHMRDIYPSTRQAMERAT